jgi:site-specific DNA-methyltransferase (adenine-specific)
MSEYSKYPRIEIITNNITDESKNEMLEFCGGDGFSIESIFMLKNNADRIESEFVDEEPVVKLIKYTFGSNITSANAKFNKPDRNSIMHKIDDHANLPNYKFINGVRVILCFLPTGVASSPLVKLSDALQKTIKSRKLLPNDEVVFVCTSDNNSQNAKQIVDDAIARAESNHIKRVIVFTGKKLGLAVTIPRCDTVIMLNKVKSIDSYYQMMFRCMSEYDNKSHGFVVDLNMNRIVNVITDYAFKIKPNLAPNDAIKYLFKQRLISINADEWQTSDVFETKKLDLTRIVSKIHDMWRSKPTNALSSLLSCIKIKHEILTADQHKILNALFKPSKNRNVAVILDEFNNANMIPDGIEKIRVEKVNDGKQEDVAEVNDGKQEDVAEVNDGKQEDVAEVNVNDADVNTEVAEITNNPAKMVKMIIPLLCILTIRSNHVCVDEILQWIKENNMEKDIFINHMRVWWGNDIPKEILDVIAVVLCAVDADNHALTNMIRTIKDIFIVNRNNKNQLSSLIDGILIPQDIEKRQNAEVSTPYALRQEMLDKIPADFWTAENSVFEPCCGKGGFVVDIIDRFMKGLSDTIPDEEERYRFIIEKLLYFADINPLNIFITKLLIDPLNEYKLNCYEGDTLELDTVAVWDVEGFCAVIGNPPYSTDPSKADSKPLYNLFIDKYIGTGWYMLFVIPSRWFVGGKGLDGFRSRMMKRRDIKLINHVDDATKWFGSIVDIKGGVNYFLKDSDHDGDCVFNGIDYKLDKYDCIIHPRHHNLIDLIKDNESIQKNYINSGYFKYRTNDKRLTTIQSDGSILCYVSQQKAKNRIMYANECVLDEQDKFWKVITARAAHGGYSGFGYMQIAKPDEIHTDSYISFRAESEVEAKSLMSYLQTKFVNHILSIRKISQDINTNVCKWIPLVPFDREWDDDVIREHFKFPEGFTL